MWAFFPCRTSLSGAGKRRTRRTLATIFRRSCCLGDYTGRIGPASFYDRRKSKCLGQLGPMTDQPGTLACRFFELIGSGDRGGLGGGGGGGPARGRGRGDGTTGR